MKFFTMQELTRSAKASELKIDNTPPASCKANLEFLVDHVLDPLREAWGAPIIVTSGYRCKTLNAAVAGVSTSQHMSGEAADIVPKNMRDIAKLYRLANQLCDYDQLLFEFNKSDGCVRCIHISCKRDIKKNRHYSNGKYML